MSGTVWPPNTRERQFSRHGLCCLPQSRKVKFNRVSNDNSDILIAKREWRPSTKEGFLRHHLQIKRDNEKGINGYMLPRRISSYFVLTFSREYDSFYPTFPQLHHFPFSFKSLLKLTIPPFTTKGTFVSQLK